MNNIKTNIIDNKIHDYLNPEYLYIPILDGYKVTVKEDSNILKEDVILSNGDIDIYSPTTKEDTTNQAIDIIKKRMEVKIEE